jgi:hypothetical protein
VSLPAIILSGRTIAKVYVPSSFLIMFAAPFSGLGLRWLATSSFVEVLSGCGKRCPLKTRA